jgi:hypothetical protein
MPLAHKAVGRHESLSASQSPPRSEHPQHPGLSDDLDSEEQTHPSSSPPLPSTAMRAAREVNTQQPPVITGTTANSKTTAANLTSKRASPIPSSPTLHTDLTDASPSSANNHEAEASKPSATAIEDVENKPRPNVTTPVSPPPSPPTTIAHSSLKPASAAAATSTTAPAQSSSSTSNDTTPRPPATELPKEASSLASPLMPNSATSQTAQAQAAFSAAPRGNSLASLLNANNKDVADASEKRESNGTPPSPDSLPQGGHSRSVSMADSSNTGRDTPMKEIREEEGMDVDQPTPSTRARDGSGGAGDIPPLYSTTLPQRRNPTPLPSSNPPSATLASSASSLQRTQPSPSPSTPVPTSSHQSYHARRHSLTQSRPYPSRSTSVTQQPQQQPIPSSQPPPLSPPSQTRSFLRTDSGEDREQQQQQYVGMLLKKQENMEHEIRRLKAQLEEQHKHSLRREDEYRSIENERNAWIRRVHHWMREGEVLIRSVYPSDYAPSAAESTTYANAGAHPSSRSLGSGSVSLSSAAVSASNAHGSMSRGYEREGPLSAVSPRSPYAVSKDLTLIRHRI